MIFYINTIAILFYLSTVTFFLIKFNRYFIFYIQLLFTTTWMLVSVYYHDSISFYNFETFLTSYPTYTTNIVAWMLISFLLGSIFVFSFMERLNFKSIELKQYISIRDILFFILIVVVLNNLIILNYLDYEKSKILSMHPMFRFFAYYAIFSMIAGIGYYYYSYKRLSIFILFCLILFGFLHGAKFTYFMETLIPFYIPYMIKNTIKIPFKIKYVLYATLIVVLILSFALFKYSYYDISNLQSGMEVLKFRLFGGQGGLAWASISSNIHDFSHITSEANKIIDTKIDSNTVGLKYLMHQLNIPDTIFERGYLLTMGFQASLYHMFGVPLSLFYSLIFGIVNAINVIYIYRAVEKYHFLRAIIAFSIFISLETVLFTGNFYVFFTFGLLVKLLILFAVESYTNKTNKLELI